MAPAPFIPGANVAELTAVYGFQEKSMSNVLHFHKTGGWDAASLQALADNYIGWEGASGKSQRSHQEALILVKARDITTQFGPVIETTDSLPLSGAVVDNCLPLNVTLALASRTGLAGRSFRGRTYFIGLPYGSVLNNQVAATPLAAIVAAYNGLITAAVGWGTPLGVFSKRTGGAWRIGGGVFTPITLFKADNIVDSQRRRLPGH